MTNNLTMGKPAKALFLFTLPMLIGNIFQQVYNFADTAIVGKYVGEDALAAIGGTFVLSFLVLGIAIGASTGCSIIISRSFGEGNMKKVKSGITTAIVSITALGILMILIGLLALDPLMRLLKTPDNIFDIAYQYVVIIFIGSPFVYLYNCLTSIFNALGDSKTPLVFLIISAIANIILDLVFILSFNMGSNGAAYATIISQAFAAFGLLIFLFRKIRFMNLNVDSKFFDLTILKEMITIAIPSIIQQSIVAIGMMAVQGLVNSFGKEMIAGYTAATKIDSIAVTPMLTISTALSTYTAQNIGANKPDRIRAGHFASIKLMLCFAIGTSIIVAFFNRSLIGLFMDSGSGTQSIQYGVEYLKIVPMFYFLMGLMFAANGVLRGLGLMKIFLTSTLVNLCMRILFAYTLVPIIGYKAIFWSLPLGWLIAGAITNIYYFSGKWKKALNLKFNEKSKA